MNPTEESAHAVFGKTFDAVLFDLDGTLIDSTGPTERAWIRWAREEGLGESYKHVGHGMPAAAIVAANVPDHRASQALERAVEIEIQETDGIVMKAGVAVLLNDIPAHAWAIVTSCTSALAAVRMTAAGLGAPETMITFDDVSMGKPDPEGFCKAAARLAVSPERCLVVEDTPAGLEAGRRAGCLTLAVAGTYPADMLVADYVVDSLEQLSISATPSGLIVSPQPGSPSH